MTEEEYGPVHQWFAGLITEEQMLEAMIEQHRAAYRGIGKAFTDGLKAEEKVRAKLARTAHYSISTVKLLGDMNEDNIKRLEARLAEVRKTLTGDKQ